MIATIGMTSTHTSFSFSLRLTGGGGSCGAAFGSNTVQP